MKETYPQPEGAEMHTFTIDGQSFTGHAREIQSRRGLRDLRVTAHGVPPDTQFLWTGRKLLFEGEADTPNGLQHVRWYVILSSRHAAGESTAILLGAGLPE